MTATATADDPAASTRAPVVYLVDDEVTLTQLAEAILRPAGYGVRSFQDPAAAWESFIREEVKPILLVTDYAMGRMNGLELIERCKAAAPELKTLMVSGTAGPEVLYEHPGRVDLFLQKPYQPAAFLEAVRRLAH